MECTVGPETERKGAEKGQDVIYVKIKALKPARSRLVKPKVAVG